MKDEKMKSLVELYICNHERDRDEDCAGKGSKELTDKLKKWTKGNHQGEIKVVRSGCLGKCSEGIAMSCYPDKKFILKVKEKDFEEITDYLLRVKKNVEGHRPD